MLSINGLKFWILLDTTNLQNMVSVRNTIIHKEKKSKSIVKMKICKKCMFNTYSNTSVRFEERVLHKLLL